MISLPDREAVSKYGVWCLVAIYPTSVLFIKHSFTPAMLLLMISGTVIYFRDKKTGCIADYSLESIFFKAGITGIFFSVISLLVSGDLMNVKTAEFEFFDKQFRFLFFAPFLVFLKKTGIPEKLIWWGAVAAALCSGLYAVSVKLVHPEVLRVTGGGNPINFGCFSIISAFISLNGFFFFKKIKKHLVFLPVTAFLSGFTGSVLSGSRGAWLAAPLLVIITFFNFKRYFRAFHVFLVIVAGLVCALVISMTFDESVLFSRLSEAGSAVKKYFDGGDELGSSSDGAFISIGGRLEMYRVAFDIIKDNPFFGAGPGRYQKEVRKKIEAGAADKGIGIYQYPHNDYLTVATCCGIPGLVLFVLTAYLLPLYIIYACSGKNIRKPLFCAGMVVIAGYMIFSVSNSTLFKNVRLHYYYLMIASIAVSLKSEQESST